VAIVFCGSKKSLATGVPMAGILFPGATAGVLVLPLMLFHQIQLMACSVIAQRYGAKTRPMAPSVRFAASSVSRRFQSPRLATRTRP
jgi:predicted Na+-dependent transporter